MVGLQVFFNGFYLARSFFSFCQHCQSIAEFGVISTTIQRVVTPVSLYEQQSPSGMDDEGLRLERVCRGCLREASPMHQLSSPGCDREEPPLAQMLVSVLMLQVRNRPAVHSARTVNKSILSKFALMPFACTAQIRSHESNVGAAFATKRCDTHDHPSRTLIPNLFDSNVRKLHVDQPAFKRRVVT